MKSFFTTGYRHPRESGGPEPACPWLEQGATAADLPPLDSRFRGNDDRQRQLVENPRFILGQPLS